MLGNSIRTTTREKDAVAVLSDTYEPQMSLNTPKLQHSHKPLFEGRCSVGITCPYILDSTREPCPFTQHIANTNAPIRGRGRSNGVPVLSAVRIFHASRVAPRGYWAPFTDRNLAHTRTNHAIARDTLHILESGVCTSV